MKKLFTIFPRWFYLALLAPLIDVGLLSWHHEVVNGYMLTWGIPLLVVILCSWTSLYVLMAFLYRGTKSVTSKIVQNTLFVIYFVVCLIVSSVVIFYWGFWWVIGYPPSGNVIEFIINNIEYIPNHILQTSPLIAISLGLTFIAIGFVLHKLVSGVNGSVRKMSFRGQALLVVFLAAVIGNVEVIQAHHYSPATYLLRGDIKANHAAELDIDAALAGFTPKEEAPSVIRKESGSGAPVIVLMVESLRRDLLEKEPEAMPFLKELASQSVVFDRAYASASHSNYADLSVWYSAYPLYRLERKDYAPDDWWRGESLFSVLKRYGYKTAYISSQNEKWGGMINWLDVPEIDYFYHSEDYEGETWLNEDDAAGIKSLIKKGVATAGKMEDSLTIDVAEKWIDTLDADTPFVLGLNLQNTHFSYVIPAGGEEPYQPSELDFRSIYYRWPEEKVTDVKNRYLNAVYNVDKIIKGFSDYLKSRGLWDKAIFVVLGDSGEGFYEHGFGNHSGPMYEEVMRTTAMLKTPGNGTKRMIEKPISHIDFVPGIIDLLGLPEEPDFQGISPFRQDSRKSVFMHTNAIVKQHAIIDGDWKLMREYYPASLVELYNIKADPDERKNLATEYPAISEMMQEKLDDWVNRQLVYYSDIKYYKAYYPPR